MKQEQVDITIIGAGLTGLTIACFLQKGGKKVCLIEKQDRPGGVIETRSEKGFTYEIGPNTGVIGSPELVELFEEMGDKCQVDTGNPSGNQRWIWKKGKWNALPSGPISAISTPLFKLKDKFRILLEPFRKPGNNPDESVADLVRRRLGESFLRYAVDPFISGVYAGDPEKLITRYALPKLYNLEQNYGSFIGGSIKKRKEPKTELEKKVTRKIFSIKGGLKNLVGALAESIGQEHIRLGCSEVRIQPSDTGFISLFVDAKGNQCKIQSKQVITTVGAYALPELLPFIEQQKINPISKLVYARVVEGIVGIKHWTGIPLNAFGGLVPSVEKRGMLGILFPSSLFEGRAPEKGAQLTFFMGGSRNPAFIEKSDEEIATIIQRELAETLNCKEQPDLLRIFRYQHAIPQYDITSGDRLLAIEQIEKEYPGLILAGNIRDGIGMADRVKQGRQLADKLLKP